MTFYYLADRERIGPLDEHGFREALRNGAIMRGTKVWHPGGKHWVAYRDLAPAQQLVPVAEVKDGPAKRYRLACAECGERVFADLLVVIDGSSSCARCRPRMEQRLAEGAPAAGQRRLGGLWARASAKVLDVLLAYAIGAVVFGVVLGIATGAGADEPLMIALFSSYILLPVVYTVYSILFLTLLQATPGKLIFGLRVCTAAGGRIRFGRACGRYFSEILTGYSIAIGYLMAVLDEERRTLHDLICSTRVIEAP